MLRKAGIRRKMNDRRRDHPVFFLFIKFCLGYINTDKQIAFNISVYGNTYCNERRTGADWSVIKSGFMPP